MLIKAAPLDPSLGYVAVNLPNLATLDPTNPAFCRVVRRLCCIGLSISIGLLLVSSSESTRSTTIGSFFSLVSRPRPRGRLPLLLSPIRWTSSIGSSSSKSSMRTPNILSLTLCPLSPTSFLVFGRFSALGMNCSGQKCSISCRGETARGALRGVDVARLFDEKPRRAASTIDAPRPFTGPMLVGFFFLL